MLDLKLTDTELQIIYLIRSLKLFDKLEIKYVKKGELMWQKIESHTGRFELEIATTEEFDRHKNVTKNQDKATKD